MNIYKYTILVILLGVLIEISIVIATALLLPNEVHGIPHE